MSSGEWAALERTLADLAAFEAARPTNEIVCREALEAVEREASLVAIQALLDTLQVQAAAEQRKRPRETARPRHRKARKTEHRPEPRPVPLAAMPRIPKRAPVPPPESAPPAPTFMAPRESEAPAWVPREAPAWASWL